MPITHQTKIIKLKINKYLLSKIGYKLKEKSQWFIILTYLIGAGMAGFESLIIISLEEITTCDLSIVISQWIMCFFYMFYYCFTVMYLLFVFSIMNLEFIHF